MSAPAQLFLLTPPGTGDGSDEVCPDCGRPVSSLFGPTQRRLLEGAPEVHVACLEGRRVRAEAARARK